MDRNRYADLLRVVAIGGVVYGHWLLIRHLPERAAVGSTRWITSAGDMGHLGVPGHACLLPGRRVRQRPVLDGASCARGNLDRVGPRPRHAAVVADGVVPRGRGARGDGGPAAGAGRAEVGQACWLAALQLWFLPVYLLLIALTPVLLAAHRRWGLAVPAVMAAAAGLVDIAVTGPHLHVIGYVNYLFVWGSIHQWGFAWQDATLTKVRWRPYALAAGGAVLLAGLLTLGPFKVDMVGSGNTNPPSIALLAYAAAQAGLVLAAERPVSRLLARPWLWRRVRQLNSTVMTVYLWHFVPVIVIGIAFYPTGVLPQPAIGTAEWWGLRAVWWALLTLVLMLLVLVVTWVQRPMLRLPAGLGRAGPWSPALLLFGLVASMAGLARLAIAGFAPGASAGLVLAACVAGLAATLSPGAPRQRVRAARAPSRGAAAVVERPGAAAAAAEGRLKLERDEAVAV